MILLFTKFTKNLNVIHQSNLRVKEFIFLFSQNFVTSQSAYYTWVCIVHGQIQNIDVQDLPSRSSLARACKIREAPGKRMINTVKKHSISSQFMSICQSCSCCKSNACLRNTHLPIRQLRAAERVAANTPTVINQGTSFISYKWRQEEGLVITNT